MITAKRVAALLAEAEANVEALRRVLAMCNGDARATKTGRASSVLSAALAIDHGRRNGSAPKLGAINAAQKAKRRATAKALEVLAAKGPMTKDQFIKAAGVSPYWFAPLARVNYITRLPNGKFKRTAKVFEADLAKVQAKVQAADK